MYSTPSLFPIPLHTFSTTLSHLTQCRPFVIYPHTAVPDTSTWYQLWLETSFFGMFFTLYHHFKFLTCLFVASRYIPSSAISTDDVGISKQNRNMRKPNTFFNVNSSRNHDKRNSLFFFVISSRNPIPPRWFVFSDRLFWPF